MVSCAPPVGAVIVGGEHPGLGIVRSLGRKGIPVCIVDDQQSVSQFSRYAGRTVRVRDLRDEQKTVDSILEVGERFGLRGWVLFPTRDETVAAFARHRERLAQFFRVTTPNWESVKWAWDKKNTYELAEQLGIPVPGTWNPRSKEDLAQLYGRLPLAIKPAIKENFFYATHSKAWRADTPAELDTLFVRATRQIRPEEVLIQEIIPGDGTRQYSYCAFFRDGKAHSSLTAMRMRQHPREFGRAATYVESVDLPEIEELSERFLKAIDYYGLVEVEFKQDPRDGKFKLLDVNARTWGFHSIGAPAGIDFPYLLFADQLGEVVPPSRGRAGVGWLRLITDMPTAASDLWHGHMDLGSYVESLKRTRVESVFSVDDPIPAIAELCMLPYLVAKKYIL
ncbi:MAG: ATP-grasp domain-containing protein [Acidobacteria bacterium]|nr:ATP-grasp domain-containing protein [Acidobacteriota bacterium]